jgi:O-antigen/teichoic acid export membrane protein
MERLEKNVLWLSAANITGSVFNALLVIYLARALEAESFGYLAYATAFVFYLFNFVDLGLSTYGIRQIARDASAAAEYVSNIISFRLLMALGLFAAFAALTFLTAGAPALKWIMALSALMLFTTALASEWAFQGMEKMHMVFISFAVTSALQLGLAVMFVKGPADAIRVPAIAVLAPLPVIAVFLRRLGFRLRISSLDLGSIKAYLSSAIVIWAISVFAQSYNGLDIVLLGIFRPAAEVGCYTVARRIVGAVAVLMVLLAGAVLPRLSRTFGSDIAQFRRATAKFLKISILMVVFVFLPLAAFSGRIISLTVGPEYLAASVPLKIMCCALTLVMFNLPFSTGLIAACCEKDVLKQAFASALVSLILNFVLMPKYGMIGASIAFLSAESLALIWILAVYNKRVRFN